MNQTWSLIPHTGTSPVGSWCGGGPETHEAPCWGGTCCQDDGFAGQGALTELGGGWSRGRGAEGDGVPRSRGGSSCWPWRPSFQASESLQSSRPRPGALAPHRCSQPPAKSHTAQGHCAGNSFDSVAAELPGRAGVLAGCSGRRGLYDTAGGAGRRGWASLCSICLHPGGQAAWALPPAGPLLPICGRKDPTPPCNSYSLARSLKPSSPLLVTLRQEQGREPAFQAPGSQTDPTPGELGVRGMPGSGSPGRKGR